MEEEHWTQSRELQIQFLALLPTSTVTSKEAPPIVSVAEGPFPPQELQSSERGKAFQKGLPGCQFEAELAVGGEVGRAPQFSHFTLLKGG